MRGVRNLLMAGLLMLTQAACADVYQDATAGHGHVITPAYFGVHFHRLMLRPGENAVRTEWPALSFGYGQAVGLDDPLGGYRAPAGPVELRAPGCLREYGGRASRIGTVHPGIDAAMGFRATGRGVFLRFRLRRRVRAHRPLGRVRAPCRATLWRQALPHMNCGTSRNFPISRGSRQDGILYGQHSQMVEMARVARKMLDELIAAALAVHAGIREWAGSPGHVSCCGREEIRPGRVLPLLCA